MAVKKKKLDELMYKDKPIVRRGNVIYYGFIDEKFIIKITEEATDTVGQLKVGTKVTVQLTSNNSKLQGNERIIRQAKKDGLYDALDVGVVWLDDFLGYEEQPQ